MTTIVINNNHCEIPNSYRNISPINSRSMNVSKELIFLSSSISSKKRLRAEEDDFADLIRISSSTEISDQADEAEHREICKNISLSLFESRKLLHSVPSSCNLTNVEKVQKDIFNSFIKDMIPPIIKNDNDDNNSNNLTNLSVLKDFLSSDNNIWNDIYVLEQEKNVYCI